MALSIQINTKETAFLQNYNAYTINDFIHLIKNKHYEDLHQNFTWNQHFEPITNWINKTDYANIIVIVYEKNLNEKINKLLRVLNIKKRILNFLFVT